MPQSEARAWWAEVQHVREAIERRRRDAAAATLDRGDAPPAAEPGEDTPAGRRGEFRTGRFDRERVEPAPPDGPRRTGRFDRGGAEPPPAERPLSGGASRDSEPRGAAPADRVPRPGSLDPALDRVGTASSRTTRRTVQITGRTVPAPALVPAQDRGRSRSTGGARRRGAGRRPVARVAHRPDRIALWAVLLGFFLLLVAAVSSSQAATTLGDRTGRDGLFVTVRVIDPGPSSAASPLTLKTSTTCGRTGDHGKRLVAALT